MTEIEARRWAVSDRVSGAVRSLTVAAALCLFLQVMAVIGAPPANAVTVTVNDENQLRNAWASPDTDVLVLGSDIVLGSCDPVDRHQPFPIGVDGGGHSIHQSCAPSVFVSTGAGAVNLNDLSIVGSSHPDPGAIVESGDIRLDRVTITDAPDDAVRSTGRITAVDTVIVGSGGNAISTSAGAVAEGVTVSCGLCRLLDNDGNGIAALSAGATARVNSSEISRNGYSGVVVTEGPWITGSTIAHNEYTGVNTTGYLRVVSSTITGNGLDGLRSLSAVAPGQHGSIIVVLSTVVGNGENNLLATNQASAYVSVLAGAGLSNCSAAETTGSAGFADDTSCSLDEHSHEGAGLDPLLGRLSYNGGATPTMRPLRGSPLIEGASWADCSDWVENWHQDVDQRGWSRPAGPSGRCDIGSVQLGGTTHDVCPVHFSDVGGDHPFCRDIDWMAGNGHSSGWHDGTYRPEMDITRQALAIFLWRLAGSPEVDLDDRFTDVGSDHEFAAAIAWAAEDGISHGYPDGTFRPAAAITRQTLAAMLWRLAGSPAPWPVGFPTFSDVAIDHQFHTPIQWLSEVQVAGGYGDGTFHPGARTTRQAMAAFLHRYDGVHQVPQM